ncbi:MAG: aminopeptidase P family N-terminal domain-containing protein, partial [Terriglobales bacterium]
MDYRSRQQRFLELLEQRNLDAFLVTHRANLRYLCGFSGSSGVLATSGGRSAFFTDGRYTAQAREQVRGMPVKMVRGNPLAAAAAWLKAGRARRLGVEAEHVTLAQREFIRGCLPSRTRLAPESGLLERLRAIKDADEIACIRAA